MSFFLSRPHVCEAQHFSDTLSVFFRRDSHIFEPEWKSNGKRCEDFIARILEIQKQSGLDIRRVEFIASASPEGRLKYNEKLAKRRSKSVTDYLHKKISFGDSILFINSIAEDWKGLESLVIEDENVPFKEEVLALIRSNVGESSEQELIQLHGGEALKYISENLFPRLRSFRVYIHIGVEAPKFPELDEIEIEDVPLKDVTYDWGEIKFDWQPIPYQDVPVWNRQMTIKTNTLGWALLGSNIGIEVDLCKHLSLSVPFYYSGGLDYFKETIKFRGIVLQPELRYYPWLNTEMKNGGFYVGAHFGLGWYNFALNGDYRVQDHAGNSPAYGGGIGIGYSLQFKKNPRWGMEFTLGGGVYSVLYDTFYNENNGPYDERATKDIWFGIDNAAVSFTYCFDLVKKGGKK